MIVLSFQKKNDLPGPKLTGRSVQNQSDLWKQAQFSLIHGGF